MALHVLISYSLLLFIFRLQEIIVREDESAKEKQDRKHRHNRAFPSDDGIVPFGLSVLSKLQASKLDSEPIQKLSRYMSCVMRKHAFVYMGKQMHRSAAQKPYS